MGAAVMALSPAAFGATWAQGTTPRLGEIFAIDKTEEPGWPYGSKDVFNDGAGFSGVPEEQRNLRTAYAAADPTRLWTRVYVSNDTAIDPAVTVYVFIDADQNTATGGGTNSTVLSPLFTAEHSPGGYDYVLGMAGNGTIAGVWAWQTSTTSYVPVTTAPTDTAAEIGHDVDPIGIAFNTSLQHGYVQGNVLLSIVGLTPACNANLYVRSAASSATPLSDLDMVYYTSCVPAKTNGIPTIVIPPNGCTSDAQCPQNGVCSAGVCVIAQTCATPADCPANYTCNGNGFCVPVGGGACTSNASCTGNLVCVNGQCAACTQGQNQCTNGMTCAPNGTCVPGTGGGGTLPAGAHVEGGAFHCAATPGRVESWFAGLLGILAVAWGVRRRSRS